MGRLYMLWLSLLRRVNEILALFMVSLICSSLYILSMGECYLGKYTCRGFYKRIVFSVNEVVYVFIFDVRIL